MTTYNKFASVYDQMGADEHSVKMVEYCRRIFKKFGIYPETGLDLCCGTGTAIRHFCEQGIKMSGLDRSAQMLSQAAIKLKGHKVTLYQKELPKFRLLDNKSGKTVTFDLVTSFYDSLNYLKSEVQLKTAFKNVAKHLNRSGWIIFDMNTPLALKTLWDEHTYAGVQSDMGWVWRNEYDPKKKSAACHATFFKKKGRLYERFDETHYEYGYTNGTIKKVLRESGFVVKGFYHCRTFDKPNKETYRICGVAQKK